MIQTSIFKSSRRGISIIEVLTSLAVATIGVFGVMVMIPFAVQRSQNGLDNDSANMLGRNAVEDLEVRGAFRVDDAGRFTELLSGFRIDFAGGTFDTSPGPAAPVYASECGILRSERGAPMNFRSYPGIWHIDPIGVSPPAGATAVPFFDVNPLDMRPITIYSASFNSALAVGRPLTTVEASALCRYRDNLVFEDPVTESADELVNFPEQVFDVGGANAVLTKRQAQERLSWSTIMVPERSPVVDRRGNANLQLAPARYRTYTLVYRDRDFFNTDPVVFATDRAVHDGAGFVQTVSRIDFDPMRPPARNADGESVISKDDWVMLVNRLPHTAATRPDGSVPPVTAPEGYRIQVAFARVSDVAEDDLSIVVDGGGFNFVDPGLLVTSNPALMNHPPSTRTYVVHLRDVINVYERSVSVERQ